MSDESGREAASEGPPGDAGDLADEPLVVTVPPALAGVRFDKAAATLFPDHSRSELTRWIGDGQLVLDGQPSKPRTKLNGGEQLTLLAQRTRREAWQAPQSMPLDILFEDEDVLVLNKASGVVVHPGAGNPDGTLVNGLLNYRPELTQLPRAGVVHRLDKDTSGVMVVAASQRAQLALTQMIAEREVTRMYHAVCETRLVAGKDIDAPIGRDPHVRTRQAIRDDGKPAYTQVRVEARYRTHTLVRAHLHTGRTHQIRVHMQSIGAPLVGDRRYGSRGRVPAAATADLRDTLQNFPRQALHASELEFTHPGNGEWLAFVAPWPDDFAQLVSALETDTQQFAESSS